MIERYGPTYAAVCDGCGEELEAEWEFQDAVDAMKRKGWKIKPPGKTGGGWSHYCPVCVAQWDFDI